MFSLWWIDPIIMFDFYCIHNKGLEYKLCISYENNKLGKIPAARIAASYNI